MVRIALGVEYDGAPYVGFQRQDEGKSVQGELERAISIIGASPISVLCAGRTDTGVHATMQVVHFDYQGSSPRPLHAWVRGTNANLPDSISVRWAKEVPESFHARFSAFARTYRYIIDNSKSRPAILTGGVSWYGGRELDEKAMHEAAQHLLGEQDFSAFRASHCQSKSPFRDVHEVSVTRRGHFVMIQITANAFLHHMVRNIAGSLIEIGYKNRPTSWIRELLDAKDRTLSGATALPNGLYLAGVSYSPSLEIPSEPTGPLWFD